MTRSTYFCKVSPSDSVVAFAVCLPQRFFYILVQKLHNYFVFKKQDVYNIKTDEPGVLWETVGHIQNNLHVKLFRKK